IQEAYDLVIEIVHDIDQPFISRSFNDDPMKIMNILSISLLLQLEQLLCEFTDFHDFFFFYPVNAHSGCKRLKKETELKNLMNIHRRDGCYYRPVVDHG